MESELKIFHSQCYEVDSFLLAQIHTRSDPNSIWGQLGVEYCERLLYKSLIQNTNCSFLLALYHTQIIGFIAIKECKTSGIGDVSFQIRNLLIQFRVLFKVLSSQILGKRFLALFSSRIRSTKLMRQCDYEIVSMMVLPEFQSKGVGRALIKFLRLHFKKISICVFTNGIRSKRFYQKNNFQVISTTHLGGQEVSYLILRA